ncbi:MAG: VCBS repeat-containing protein, partial [Deltaproteobacteria bacterium]|nr:VCBS repeat-containing protein [Deltaproteobacteria bacterium]
MDENGLWMACSKQWIFGLIGVWASCYRAHEMPEDVGKQEAFPTSEVWDGRGMEGGVDGAQRDAFEVRNPPDPELCIGRPVVDPFDVPVLKYRWPGTKKIERPSSVHVCATPVVIDPDGVGDGEEPHPVIAFVSYDSLIDEQGVLRIWNPIEDTTITYPADPTARGPFEASTHLAAGDLDGDGDIEFVGLGVHDSTYAVHHDGSLFWISAYPPAMDRGERWERSIGGAPTLADLNGDGRVEVVVGRWVLDGTNGDLIVAGLDQRSRGINQMLGPISCVADLDEDGEQEVIVGNGVFRMDGSVVWRNESLPDGFCAVADILESDPGPEVVLVGMGWIRLLDEQSGEVRWSRLIEGQSGPPGGGPPTVGDFDGDGDVEIAVAHASMYGVYDPDCIAPGSPPGCGDTGLRWIQPSDDGSSAVTGSSLFDFNGDGVTEVIYNDHHEFRIFNGVTGQVLFSHPNSSRTRTEYPVVADVDADGSAEIVFPANAEASFLRPRWTEPGVFVWGDARGRWV